MRRGDAAIADGWDAWWKRRGEAELRRLLLVEWDPIGIADVPKAQDEYDSYVGPLASRCAPERRLSTCTST